MIENLGRKFKVPTRKALLAYTGLALSALLVPNNFVHYSQVAFTFLIGVYVILWYKILRYLWFRTNSQDDKDRWDYLIFDIIYIVGLPIILNLMVVGIGRGLFVELYMAVIYYLVVVVILLVKLALMKSRVYHMVRFVITLLFLMMNVIVLQQIFNIWYGVNYLGQGF